MKRKLWGDFVDFPAWLDEQMRRRGYNQSALARGLGIQQSTVSQWLSGKSEPTTTNLIALARLFDLNTNSVLQMFEDADAPYQMSPEMAGLVEVLDRKLEAIEDPRVKELAIARLKHDITALTDMVESLSDFIDSLPTKDGQT